VAIEKKESMYKDKDGNKVYNMLAHFMDKGIKFISYLPSNYNNPDDDDIEMFNKDIKDKKPGFVVYYGTIGNAKQFEFLPFGSGKSNLMICAEFFLCFRNVSLGNCVFIADVDKEKLETVAAVEEEEKLAKANVQCDSALEPSKRFKKE
jgi:hypothetical protein